MIYKSFSWSIDDENIIAYKQCDKSFFEYCETGIPSDTLSYWQFNKNSKEKKYIKLIYKQIEYQGYMSTTYNNNSIRVRLKFESLLRDNILKNEKFDIFLVAKFTKINDNIFALEFLSDNIDEIDSVDVSSMVSVIKTEDLKNIAEKRSASTKSKMVLAYNRFSRDCYIAEYSKRIANGVCQLCDKNAPFLDKKGRPYLESHHIVWISMGGADTIDNTVALCPNCHRRIHVLNDNHDTQKLINKKQLLV